MSANQKQMKLAVEIAGKVDKSFGASIKTATSKMKSISKIAIAAVAASSAALAGLASKAIEAGIEYESAFAGVKKTVDATDAQLKQLDSDIRQMSTQMPTTATEIAAVAEAAGQLGIKTENISQFTEVMVKLGDATNLTADEASTTLARFANVTQMDPSKYSNLGSTIVALGNNFATTESEIAAMAQNLASAGTQVGMTEAQIMGISAALSSVGLEAAAGGTAMSKLMVNMQLAAEKGGSSLQQYADVAGMSSSAFQKAFKEDAAGAITSFLKGLNDSEKNGKSAIAVLDEMGITETRLRDTILRAAGAGSTFSEAIKMGTAAWRENVALDNEVEQRYSTMESRINILKNAVTNLGISFYNSTRDDIGGAVDIASESINTLQSAFDSGGLSGMLEALGGVISNVFNYIVEALPSLITAGADMLNSLINGICSNSQAIVDAIMQLINTFCNGIITMLPTILQMGCEILIQLVLGIAQQAPVLIPQIVQVIIRLCEVFNENFDLFMEAGLQLIIGLIKGIINSLPLIVQNIGTIITTIFNILTIQGVGSLAKAGGSLIRSLGNGLTSNFGNILKNVPNMLKSLVSAFKGSGINGFKSVGKTIIKIIGNAFTNAIPNLIATAKAGLKKVASSLGKAFSFKIGGSVSSSSSDSGKKSKKHAKGGIFRSSTIIPAINAAHAAGGVFTKPTVIPSVNGANHLVGEAGAEAILPLDSLWKQFENVNSNIQTLQQNQKVVSISLDPNFVASNEKLKALSNALTKQVGQSNPAKKDKESNDNPQIVYSPTIIIQGDADKEDVAEATKISFEEFKKLYKKMKKEENRVKF